MQLNTNSTKMMATISTTTVTTMRNMMTISIAETTTKGMPWMYCIKEESFTTFGEIAWIISLTHQGLIPTATITTIMGLSNENNIIINKIMGIIHNCSNKIQQKIIL